jgi:hypothetical protein
MSEVEECARAIYQRLLDEIGSAIVERDRGKYVDFFLLPHRLQTFETSVNIVTPAELEAYFDKLVERLSDLGVSELTRHCTIANFLDDKTIRGYHETKLINQSLVIVDDYLALSTLTDTGGAWKVSASQYAEREPSLPTHITRSEQRPLQK